MIQQLVFQLIEKEAPTLNGIEKRELCGMTLQHNPKRAISSGAKVDKVSIAKRPCFLCKSNRPESQESVIYNDDFEILINPFPILEGHLTIPLRRHEPQQILAHLDTMAEMAKVLPKFTLFYNGAKCGASAPDHMHFQAVYTGQTPMEQGKNSPSFVRMTKHHSVDEVRNKILSLGAEAEQMVNLFCHYDEEKNVFDFYLFERKKHRPSIYEEGIMISPGALDMAGILVLPQKEVYENITAEIINKVFEEV